MMKISFLILFSIYFHGTLGHGDMYYPWPWHATTECSPNENPKHCHYDLQAPIPQKHCEGEIKSECRFHMGETEWYTNFTYIPGEATLPDEMYDEWSHPDDHPHILTKPWASPGTAPTWGEGCGANGGNPLGCGHDGDLYGTCCGGHCGGYTYGKSAIEHHNEGLFNNASYGVWTRGKPADVYWKASADHRGGYAYRLCKVPPQGISKVTEKCFNDGHLDFYGDTAWIYYHANHHFDPELWEPINAVRTRIGTFPPGSEWAKMSLPTPSESRANWTFKDLVKVPENIEPGDYVLSFRWDCQKTPQVWNSCANIRII